jgi:tetratricopeptide (TPR) repeat protein
MSDYYEQIEDYLSDALDDAAKSAFERAMATDPELRRETEDQRNLIHRLQAMGHRQGIRRHVRIEEGALSTRWRLILLIAAVAAIAAAALVLSRKTATGEPLPPENEATSSTIEQPIAIESPAAEPELSPVEKKGKDERPGSLSKAMLAYMQTLQDQEFIQLTAMGEGDSDQNTEIALNRAIEWMRQGEPARAEKLLLPLLKTAPEDYRDDAEWLYALCWLPRDEAKADSLLKNIEKASDHPYRRKAMLLLDRL